MNDEPKGQENEGEGKPQESMPDSNKPAEGELPEGTSSRTAEQFEKLKQSNQQLKAENDSLKVVETTTPDVLDSLRPKTQAQPNTQGRNPFANKAPVQENKFISDDGTQVDPYLLEKNLNESKLAAQQAQQIAEQAREESRRYAETQQVREAHNKFPQLNPKSSDYDAKFYKAVKNEVVGQMTQGYQDLAAAADSVAEWYQLSPLKKEQADGQAAQTQTQKEQINATTPAKPMAKIDQDVLVNRQRKGDRDATIERLERSGF